MVTYVNNRLDRHPRRKASCGTKGASSLAPTGAEMSGSQDRPAGPKRQRSTPRQGFQDREWSDRWPTANRWRTTGMAYPAEARGSSAKSRPCCSALHRCRRGRYGASRRAGCHSTASRGVRNGGGEACSVAYSHGSPTARRWWLLSGVSPAPLRHDSAHLLYPTTRGIVFT